MLWENRAHLSLPIVVSYDILLKMPLKRPSVLFLFCLLYPNVFSRFLSFSRLNIARNGFFKTMLKERFRGYGSINLFMKNPFKDFR